jgi:hypothetical protein
MDSVCIILLLDRIDGILDPKRKDSIGVSVVSCPLSVAESNSFYLGGMDSIFMNLLLDRIDRIKRMGFVFRQFPDEIAET